MPYKDILVVLDDTSECRERVEVALRLAGKHENHLTGLFVVEYGDIPAYVAAQIPQEVFAQRREMADAARARVRAAGERHWSHDRVAHG